MSVALPKIVLFGDSITEQTTDPSLSFSLPSALQHAYRRRFDVVIRGYSGITTTKLLPFFEPLLDSLTTKDSAIELAVIFLGSNDAALGFEHSVTLQDYLDNLEKMILMAHKRGIKVIIVGPAANIEIPDKPGRKTLVKLEYSNAAKDLAKKLNAPYIDLWHAFIAASGYPESSPDVPIPGQIDVESPYTAALNELMSDGLHFSGKGYAIWYEKLMECIKTNYPELTPFEKPPILKLGGLTYGGP